MEFPCENTNIHLTTLTKLFFAFLCKKLKKVSGVARLKLKIYSKHSLNKVKTKRNKTIFIAEYEYLKNEKETTL